MTSLLTVVVSILVFGAVIFIHELGHFLAAKRCGIRVNEFAIGMGPALLQKTKGETKYSLRLFPIGGFTAMEGEEGVDEEDEDSALGIARATIAATPAGAHKRAGAWPLLISGKAFGEATIPQRMLVIAAGALMNFVLGFAVLLVLVGMQDTLYSKIIYGFSAEEKAQASGLQVEDEILTVNGSHCFVVADIAYELQRSENYTADLTVLRNGKVVTLPGVQFDPPGKSFGIIVYGVTKTPRSVVKEAANEFFYYGRLIFRSLFDLVRGRVAVKDLSGPVGIVSAVSEAVSYGLQDVLSLAALITINLGIFNLLPLPALDGGRLVFLAVEGITRHPVPIKVQAAVNAAGMVLLLALMLFVTFNDISRFIR